MGIGKVAGPYIGQKDGICEAGAVLSPLCGGSGEQQAPLASNHGSPPTQFPKQQQQNLKS